MKRYVKCSKDNRLASTSERYKGYLIRLNNRTESYDIYDSHRALEETGFNSLEQAKEWIDEYISIYQDSVYPNI